jgi:hypothetical protein
MSLGSVVGWHWWWLLVVRRVSPGQWRRNEWRRRIR